MLHVEIKDTYDDKFIPSYIEFTKGAGWWQHPIGNNKDNKFLTRSEAEDLTMQIVDLIKEYCKNK